MTEKPIFPALNLLEPVSLDEIKEARLMNRIDNKYITRVDKVNQLLALAALDYFILEIDGCRIMDYATRYFDTENLEMYNLHRRGKKARQKIRIRSYLNNDVSEFLEIKDKNNKGKTRKKRTPFDSTLNITDYNEFITGNSLYQTSHLFPVINNRFQRITLVRKDRSERITIDIEIVFKNILTGNEADAGKIAVIEWKRKGLSDSSPMRRILKQLHIRETGFSKYVIGMAKTDPGLRKNRLKPRLRLINKLSSPALLHP